MTNFIQRQPVILRNKTDHKNQAPIISMTEDATFLGVKQAW